MKLKKVGMIYFIHSQAECEGWAWFDVIRRRGGVLAAFSIVYVCSLNYNK